ncbi:MAG: F0F1 ATP synthase subunit A [Thiotrichaceae bacterium]|nr:F0F1 ATP synthase subunit A [Thiotrichaceae bacterium]
MSETNAPAIADQGSYINHHLHNATYNVSTGKFNVDPGSILDFNILFLDTLFVTIVLSFIIGLFAWRVGKNLSADTPSGAQNFLETIVEFVNQQVTDIFPKADRLVGPLALTIFTIVFLMNLMDIIPVDLLPGLVSGIASTFFGADPHHIYFKAVPTTNLDTTFALALLVFGLIIFYNIKHKGLVGYIKMFLFHPFGKFAMPVNILMTAIEEVAKPVSLGLRLFGNMFAGELLFLLIALLGFGWAVPGEILLGFLWSVFHLLVIPLQAFIFMLLTIVYLSLASQGTDEH